MKTFHVICAGEEEKLDFAVKGGDCLVACDGGLEYAEKYGLKCDVVLGDFDSLGYVPQGGSVIRLPCEKDDTDTFAAVKLGMARGYDEFVLHCASGGEIDHTLANVSALIYLAKAGKRNKMTDKNRTISAVCNGTARFKKSASGRISVFCADESCFVKIKGLKYEYDGRLENSFPLGVSNEFAGKQSSIQVEGTAVIIYPCGEDIEIT